MPISVATSLGVRRPLYWNFHPLGADSQTKYDVRLGKQTSKMEDLRFLFMDDHKVE